MPLANGRCLELALYSPTQIPTAALTSTTAAMLARGKSRHGLGKSLGT